MTKKRLHILLVEDNPGDVRLLRELIGDDRSAGVDLTCAERLEEALALCRDRSFDVMLLDLSLPDSEGLETIDRARKALPAMPIVLLTGRSDEGLGLAAVQAGAQDYLTKGRIDGAMLLRVLRYSIERARSQKRLRDAHSELERRIEQRTAELAEVNAQLTESEARFRDLADSVREVFYLIELEPGNPAGYRLLFVNRAFDNVWGIPRGDLALEPRRWLESIHEADRPRVVEAFRALCAEGAPFDEEYRIVRPDGEVRWILDRTFPVRSQPTNRHRIGGIAEDITERKLAEEKVRRLVRGLEAAGESIIMTDANGVIEYVNPAFTAMTDYTPEDVQGQTPRILKSGRHPLAMYKALWGTILQGDTWSSELVNRRKDGTLYDARITISPVRGPDGKIEGFVSVHADISNRKQLEERLRAAKEAADAASAAKSEFLANMSHELRTPLNGVIGMLELLLSTDLDAQQRRHAWLAKASGDMLLTLINDILDFSKIEAGKLELEHTAFDLHYAIESVAASFASKADAKGLELITGIHPTVPRRLMGDPGRVQQILTNLINNAIKFTDTGEVVVRATLDEEDNDRAVVRMTVTDTGPGIPEAQQKRLFQTFSQGDPSTTRRYGGTGLGLAICRNLVGLMGGQIGVSSDEGHGSIFWLTIPFQRVPGAVVDAPVIPADLRAIRVLAVDDNATNREIIHEQLRVFGLCNDVAASGPEALEKLRAAAADGTPYTLAILDMQMPGMSGIEVARAIRKDPAIQDTVMILLTSTRDAGDPRSLREAGFASWLVKPIRQEHLLDSISDALACATSAPSVAGAFSASSVAVVTPIEGAAAARILVADDHEISQEVATTILSRAGYNCTVVSNGQDAVSAVQRGGFDLVLMDCQMPVMDGFDATRTIRRMEHDAGDATHIPIVALTANAIKGDRERCLAAGMDDYLAKPLEAARLIETVGRYLSSPRTSRPRDTPPGGAGHRDSAAAPTITARNADAAVSVGPGSGSARNMPAHTNAPDGETRMGDQRNTDSASKADGFQPPAINVDGAIKRWGGDGALAARVLQKFCEKAPQDLDHLEAALEAGQVDETRRLAHGLKGAASYVHAEAVRRAALELETIAREKRMDDAPPALEMLRSALAKCLKAVPEAMAKMSRPEAAPVAGRSS